MIRIILDGIENKYEYEELTKIFINPKDFFMTCDTDEDYEEPEGITNTIHIDAKKLAGDSCDEKHLKNLVKHQLYEELASITGLRPDWGIMTGVRPVKLAGDLVRKHGLKEASSLIKDLYLLTDEKRELVLDTFLYQQDHTGVPADHSFGLYVGIPFCPTRCLYCSFTSNQKGPEEINKYLLALYKEIDFCGKAAREAGYHVESIYIGGGTPTTLDAQQLDVLLNRIERAFDMSTVKEFTVEAGRPDTIDYHKLGVLAMHGINRISINPQSMKDKTLELIGRAHTCEDTRNAMKLAKEMGMTFVNMDVIAGLPEETPEDFSATLDELIEYGAANITVHTLAVKRASRLVEQDPDYHYKHAKVVREMLDIAKEKLTAAGYRPYYLYRQKHMTGGFENIGWCRDDAYCIYNIRIMEEEQTIVALGAGGISKQYYPAENRHERVPNVSNYEIYIERLDEMLERKHINLFK